jgi:hypothetical protein
VIGSYNITPEQIQVLCQILSSKKYGEVRYANNGIVGSCIESIADQYNIKKTMCSSRYVQTKSHLIARDELLTPRVMIQKFDFTCDHIVIIQPSKSPAKADVCSLAIRYLKKCPFVVITPDAR